MPPKAVKKTPTGSASKRGGRTTRGTPKSQGKQPVVEADEPVKVEISAGVEEKKKVEVKQESKAEQSVADQKADPEKSVKSVEHRVVSEKSKYYYRFLVNWCYMNFVDELLAWEFRSACLYHTS